MSRSGKVSTTVLSKDIQSLVPADKVDDNYTIKRKILWGPDGVQYDITPLTPLPVTVVSGGGGGWSSFGQGTPTQILVSTSSTQLLAANVNRIFARISNNSNQTIYIQYGVTAVWQQGLRLSPGASLTISTAELYNGSINAVSQSTTVAIDVIEGVV